MMSRKVIVSLFALFFLCSCVQVEKTTTSLKFLGTSLKLHAQGRHYLETRDYKKGESLFRRAVKENPANPAANYYLGRFLLAKQKNEGALSYLKKAVSLDPKDADYNFWLGLAYGENGKRKEERQKYKKALALDPKHLQSLIYLGHSQLRSKEYNDALVSYKKAMKIWPFSPSALYNRALIMKILGRTPEAKLAWLEYLDLYPAGALARRATDHLNLLSDFSPKRSNARLV